MSKIATLLQKDVRGVYRDGFLLLLLGYPFLLALGVRLLVPWVPIEHVGLYVAPFVVTLGAITIGIVLGFSLIEERELQTSLLLRVLPLSSPALFGYLTATSSGLALVATLAGAWIYGLPVADVPAFLGLVLASATLAPFVMWILGAASTNKIEGMALAKIVSTSGLVPLLVFVLPPAWQPLLFWNPLYWIYVGLLRAWAGPLAPELAASWPMLPGWSFVVAPLLLCLGGAVALSRVYRRRAQ